jgi:endo-1,4-beta-xylanase
MVIREHGGHAGSITRSDPILNGHVMSDFSGSPITRRSAVLGLAGTAIASATATPTAAPAGGDFALELEPSLRSRSSKSGIKFGCAGAAPIVHPDPIMLEKMSTEANIFIPEGHLKWEHTEPRQNEFDFAGPDSVVDYAARREMIMHGHTLVWYAAIPDWVSRLATAKDARTALERHIGTLVSRYRGRIWAWDVLNEPIEPKDGLANGYRNSIWFRLLGIEHVDLSFQLARAADPVTPLCLNEYGFEYTTAVSKRRRQDILALLRKLRERNTPVDIFGLQSHLDCHQTFDRKELAAFLQSVVELGYRLMITELDVNDVQIRGNEAERDAAVERHVAEYLEIVFSVARPMSISTWGLTDRYTWMRQYYKRTDGRPLRPLPLDSDLNRKPMWATLAKYLSS